MAKLTLSLGSKPLQSLTLTDREILIGSNRSCDIPIDDASLRPVHARITGKGKDYHVAAANGTGELRISLDAPALLSTPEEKWETRLIDLSLTGALVELPDGWTGRMGSYYTLRVRLTNQSYFSTEVVIRQADRDRLGMAFADLDQHGRDVIRWLMEVSIGDTSLLRHELSDLT
jgi:hypothetical protein